MQLNSFYKDLHKSLTFYTTVFMFIVYFMTKIHANYLMKKYLQEGYYLLEENYFNCVLYTWGATYTPSIRNHFQYWRLLCSTFLHASLKHIVSNMITQISFGFIAEITQGRKRTVILYIAGGIGASLFSCVRDSYGIGVGASGAIFSLLALELVYYIKTYPNLDQNRMFAFIILGSMVFLSFIDPPPQVDVAGHFGGLLVGLLISTGYAFADSRNHYLKQYQYIFHGLVGMLFIYLLKKIQDDKILDTQICQEFNII